MSSLVSNNLLIKYSKTSMARAPMARLPWLIRTRLSPYEILPTAQENKYLGTFSYFIINFYVECTHWNRLIDPGYLNFRFVINIMFN